MSKITLVKIDVKKIDKDRLFKGEKGTYLDAAIIWNDSPDQYGNDGMVVQQVSKEERQAGEQGAILGNVRNLEQAEDNRTSEPDNSLNDVDSDLPFMWLTPLLIPALYSLQSFI